MKKSMAIGVDIGGTHITAGLVDLSSYSLHKESIIRKEVDSRSCTSQIIKQWSSCIRKLKELNTSNVIGIAIPGPFNYTEGISLIKNQGKYDMLYKKNVRHLLMRELRCTNTQNLQLQNDAVCFLRGEMICGVARNTSRAVGITIGTGLGTARSINGRTEDADLWNTPYKGGIIENYLSTRWFVNIYWQKTGHLVKGVKELVENGIDNIVQSIFSEYAENLTSFLKVLIKMDNPEIVVIGGNIAKASARYLPAVRSNLSKAGITTTITVSELGERATLVGAALSQAIHTTS